MNSYTTIAQRDAGFAPGATLLRAYRPVSGAVAQRMAQRLERLLELDSAWDGADALRLDRDAVATAGRVIAQAISVGLPEPGLFPVPDGGVQVEWRAGSVELELEIEPGERAVVFVCEDEQTGLEIAGELPRDRSLLGLAFARLAAYA